MIDAKAINKKYYQNIILNNVHFTLARKGMIGIIGPSGCGKTTLLKIIAGLISFEGDLAVLQQEYQRLDFVKLCAFRNRYLGLLFQNYRLFEKETVYWNVTLPLWLSGQHNQQQIKHQCQQILKLVGLDRRQYDLVYQLSGGEKQRVALARCLINEPRIILADEPTAALDGANKQMVIGLLKQIALQRLVIIVSHDTSLLKQHCQTIYRIKKQQVILDSQQEREIQTGAFHFRRLNKAQYRGKLPWRFAFRHTLTSNKSQKIRHFVSQLMLSISLLGFGMGHLIVASSESKITDTLKQFMGTSGIVLSQDYYQNSYLDSTYSIEEDTLIEIYNRYQDVSNGYGYVYQNDFESFFPHRHDFNIMYQGPMLKMPSLHIRQIAEAKLASQFNLPTLSLADDEIILGLTNEDLTSLATYLRVVNNGSSINDFLNSNFVYLQAAFANEDWQYDDEQLWRLRYVIKTETPQFIHTNCRWNQFVLEESMRFPTTTKLEGPLERPWILRKIATLISVDQTRLMQTLCKDMSLSIYQFDYVNLKQWPLTCQKNHLCQSSRIAIYLDPYRGLDSATLHYLKIAEPRLSETIICSSGGYIIYPEALISGFVNETFFTPFEMNLDLISDWLSYEKEIGMINNLPDHIARGHYLDQSNTSVRLKTFYDTKFIGSKPNHLLEIGISTGLAKQLFKHEQVINQPVYMMIRFIDEQGERGVYSQFQTIQLNITSLIEDSQLAIYAADMWSVDFYRDIVGINYEQLRPMFAYFESDESHFHLIETRIKRLFPFIKIQFPMVNLKQSLNSVTSNINKAMLAISLFACFNALILAMLVISIALEEMKPEQKLLIELGANQTAIKQLLLAKIIILLSKSFVFSISQLVLMSFLVEKLLADYFYTSFKLKIPYLSMGIITLAAFLIFFLLSLMINRLVKQQKNE